jgi:DNA-binding transcriptional LysR family regulator
LCQLVLPGILSEIQRKHPDLDLSLLSSNSHLDLARLSADIAVRPALKLEDGLIGQLPANCILPLMMTARCSGTGLV